MDLLDWEDKYIGRILSTGAMLGLLAVEVTYFRVAEPRRLLMVLVLAPLGALAGCIVTGLTYLFLTRIVPALAILTVSVLGLIVVMWLFVQFVELLWNITF